MVWAVKNGMVGVNMQRRSGEAWDDPAKDVSLVVQWVNNNIAQHNGNPNRVFAWSQSAGNIPPSTYVAHSEFWGTEGIGLKGVIFMSPPAFDILPVAPPPVQGAAFAPCGPPNGGPPAAPKVNVTYVVYKDHSHISEVMSPDTDDQSVSGPILKWMKGVK